MYKLRMTKQLKYFDEVIQLHYEEGYDRERIASVLHIDPSTVSHWITIFAWGCVMLSASFHAKKTHK